MYKRIFLNSIILVTVILTVKSHARFYDYIGAGHWDSNTMNATASSEFRSPQPDGDPLYLAEYTVDGSGLDSTGLLHDSNALRMWITNPSPNSTEVSHENGADYFPPGSNDVNDDYYWIEYDFGEPYILYDMWVWNYNCMDDVNDPNNPDPNGRGYGLRDVYVNFSVDGNTWHQLPGNELWWRTWQFAIADGNDGYEHNTEIPFGGLRARYVLIYGVRYNYNQNTNEWNVKQQWGAPYSLWGLSEVRFNVSDKYSYLGAGEWDTNTMSVSSSSEYLYLGNPFYKDDYLVDGSGLDSNGLHNTTAADMWLTNVYPNHMTNIHPAASNDYYWVEFDLGETRVLDNMWIWNYGSVTGGGDYTARGLKDVFIKTSTNDVNWPLFPGTGYDSTHQFAKTSTTTGVPFAHNTEIDFKGLAARYVLIYSSPWNANTVPEWGASQGAWGLSEIQLNIAQREKGYPKIGSLWPISFYYLYPTQIDYDVWGKYDLIITDQFGSLDEWNVFQQNMRARNPQTKLIRSGLLTLIFPNEPWMDPNGYVLDSSGEKVLFWANTSAIPNITMENVYNDVLAYNINDTNAGAILEAGYADGLFFDATAHITFFNGGDVDTDVNGVPDNPSWVDPLWNGLQNDFFTDLKNKYPKCMIIANDIEEASVHGPYYNGRLSEGHFLLDDVASGKKTPAQAITTINSWLTQGSDPNLTLVQMGHPMGSQSWRVGQGKTVTTEEEIDLVRRDFARMRLGLMTTLMTDAYYSYDFGTVAYGYPLWYAEYDARLGSPLGDYQTDGNNVMTREYDNGLVVLNASSSSQTKTLNYTMQRLDDNNDAPLFVRMYDANSVGNHGDYIIYMSDVNDWGSYGGAARFLGENYLMTTTESNAWIRWNFVAPSTDTYTFFANLSNGPALDPNAKYELLHGGPTEYVDQQVGGKGGWVELFSHPLTKGITCEVQLTSDANWTMADVLRIESDARFNDGTDVNSVTLDPLDGCILMKK